MAVETHIYDDKFFLNTIKLESASAQAAVAILLKYFPVKSVIDMGCGCGIYLKAFQEQGLEIIGYDGAPAAIAASLVGDKIKLYDLVLSLRILEYYISEENSAGVTHCVIQLEKGLKSFS